MDTSRTILAKGHSTETEQLRDTHGRLKKDGKPGEDLTGRDRLVSNVLFNWGAHFVFIIAGFVLPRMIDHHLGRELLGLWDFSWSVVSYFTLVTLGVGSSIDRYVAKYRAANDISGLNCATSSAFCILGLASALVLTLTIAVTLLLPKWFGPRLKDHALVAQWVVFFLGSSICSEVFFSPFWGVLIGCHRWKVHNAIKSGWHAVAVAGMVVALLWGGSLASLALIYCMSCFLADITRVGAAHRVCEGLRVSPFLARAAMMKQMFLFGGKTLVPSISKLLLNQTTNMLIMTYLGPMALALYARPQSLTLHMHTLVDKMSMVLTPTASSLQSINDVEAIRTILVKSVRYSCYMALPMVLVLAVFGGPILSLWMGPDYANDIIPAILAIGYLAVMVNMPLMSVLVGLNAHGRAGMAQFIASLCSAGLMFLVLGGWGGGLVWAAVASTVPLMIVNVAYLPLLICRRISLDVKRYFMAVTAGPVVHVLPFVICLVGARIIFRAEPLAGLAWGGVAGGALLAVLYYRYVLPERIKRQMSRWVGLGRAVA